MEAAGVTLETEGDQLSVASPVPLSEPQRAWLRQHKAELITILAESRPNLHGWTLEQIQTHCQPDQWAEIKDNPAALEAVAADLRGHLSLCSGTRHVGSDVPVPLAPPPDHAAASFYEGVLGNKPRAIATLVPPQVAEAERIGLIPRGFRTDVVIVAYRNHGAQGLLAIPESGYDAFDLLEMFTTSN